MLLTLTLKSAANEQTEGRGTVSPCNLAPLTSESTLIMKVTTLKNSDGVS